MMDYGGEPVALRRRIRDGRYWLTNDSHSLTFLNSLPNSRDYLKHTYHVKSSKPVERPSLSHPN